MGGQIGTDGALFIDMRKMTKVLDFKPKQKLITVQTGRQWRALQRNIDPYSLSLMFIKVTTTFLSVGL